MRTKKIVLDLFIWLAAMLIATYLRLESDVENQIFLDSSAIGIFSGCLFSAFMSFFSMYNLRYRLTEVYNFLILIYINLVVVIMIYLIIYTFNISIIPRSVVLIAGFISTVTQIFVRVISAERLNYFNRQNIKGDNTLIYGAGIAGQQLVKQMLSNDSNYNPVGFLDNDFNLKYIHVNGRKVLGDISDLDFLVKKYDIKILLVAISNIDYNQLTTLRVSCEDLGIILRVIPTANEIISGQIDLIDVKELTEETLIGRSRNFFTSQEIFDFYHHKKILVTGAAGSIGSEIARQIYKIDAKNLYLLDRDESALLRLQLSLDGLGSLTGNNLILADIRDKESMTEIINKIQPDFVFHAAALKHLSLLERFPKEAFKTNILGTQNLIKLCEENNVAYLINISTDKAADPSSILGESKLVTEKLVASVIRNKLQKYISVRFGNVFGSNGSFIEVIRHQIKTGGPVTITHPDVERFFMTIEEAVNLVLHAPLVGEHGQTLILDMGNLVRVEDIVKKMIQASGKKVEIMYTGLRPGEKLKESLTGFDENLVNTNHKSIFATTVDVSNMELPTWG